jgi:transposase
LTWPTTPRWWWSATTTRGCWPAGPGGAALAARQGVGWGLAVACRRGFAGVVVACEPTGRRWPVLVEQASGLGLEAVWVQPLLVRRAREAEDFTRDKRDDKTPC